jgi:hypothetical protein
MLGLDLIGASGGGSAGAAADRVASKAKTVASRAGKARGIAAYAKKAADRAGKVKAQAAKAAKSKVKKPKPVAKTPTRALTTAAPPPLTATAARSRVSVRGDISDLTVQAIDPSILMAAINEMNGYDTGLNDASSILQLVGQINQLLPAVQASGRTDLYNQGQALLNEAYSYNPASPTDLAARCTAWIAQAQAAGAYPGVGQPQQVPLDSGGDYGGGGGGGGGAPAPADGGGEDGGYDPEADSAQEAAEIESQDGGDDDGDSYDDAPAGDDDGGDDQVVGVRGLDLLGANTGLEAGVDINAANQAVRGAKPLSQALARKFISLATKCLQAANMLDTQEGATARRNNLIEKLDSMDGTMREHPTLDPLPEAGAQNSPAEMLRNTVLQAIVEYNSAAEGIATLAEARSQLWADFVQSAKDLANKAGSTASSILTWLKWLAIGAGVIAVGGGSYILYQKGMREYVRS